MFVVYVFSIFTTILWILTLAFKNYFKTFARLEALQGPSTQLK